MADITTMANKGKQKYDSKKGSMVANYQSATARMIAGYNRVGFGPQMTKAYADGVNLGKQFYTADALNSQKWYDNWLAKARA